MTFAQAQSQVSSYVFFPNATEEDKNAHDYWLEGYTDGSTNATPNLKYNCTDDAYTLGYIEGLQFWASNPNNTKIKPVCGMCIHFSDRQGRCEKLNCPMAENSLPCFAYEEYCPF